MAGQPETAALFFGSSQTDRTRIHACPDTGELRRYEAYFSMMEKYQKAIGGTGTHRAGLTGYEFGIGRAVNAYAPLSVPADCPLR